MNVLRYSLIVIAALALPSCGTDSPTTPAGPGGGALLPAQISATVVFSNATAAAQSISANGPARALYEAIVDMTFTNPAGNATATVDLTATLIFTDDSKGNPRTFDPFAVPGGESITIRTTFEPKVPTSSPNRPKGVGLDTTWTDTLNNTGNLMEEYDADASLNWGQKPPEPCVSGGTIGCLNNGRFRAEVNWRADANDSLVPAIVDINFAPGSLVFLFGAQAGQGNDLLVQLLDNCNNNDHFWVFASSATNVEFDLTVTDTQSNVEKTYSNPLGLPAQAITDTQAFATCPGPVPVP